MALLRTRNKTLRTIYHVGKVLLPVIWVCWFVMVYSDRSPILDASSVTMAPVLSTKLVIMKETNREASVRSSTTRVAFYIETDDHKASSLQDYQILHKKDFRSNDTYSVTEKEDLTKNKIVKERPRECRLYPDILIIGFEKCGTMTLRSYLGTHPQVYISNSNLSIPYFNSVKYESLETFTKNMSCTPKGKLRLEKISTYGLAVKAYEILPNIKLLAMVREPVDRAMSHHVHRIARSKEKSTDFDALIESMLDDRSDKVSAVKKSVLFRQSTYIDRLQQWLQTYGRDKILVIDGDNFITNPTIEINRVEKFLNISSYFTKDHFVFNPVKQFYCLKTAKNDTSGCMNSDKGRPHPRMSEVTRTRLQDYFRPFNEKLFHVLGQNFSWNY